MRAAGFGPRDRAVIIHADDLGMNGSTVPAFEDLLEAGVVTSGSVMTPCPWFPAMAELCRGRKDLDIGVHITLTSEWRGYRWRPLTGSTPETGLVDDAGFFHATRAMATERACPEAAYREMKAQVEAARKSGIQVTHMDSHMFTSVQPRLLSAYRKVAEEERLPCFVPGDGQDNPKPLMLDADTAEGCAAQVKMLAGGLEPGLYHLLIHPAKDTPELREIVPAWRRRVAEYECFLDRGLRNHLENAGIALIGYGALA